MNDASVSTLSSQFGRPTPKPAAGAIFVRYTGAAVDAEPTTTLVPGKSSGDTPASDKVAKANAPKKKPTTSCIANNWRWVEPCCKELKGQYDVSGPSCTFNTTRTDNDAREELQWRRCVRGQRKSTERKPLATCRMAGATNKKNGAIVKGVSLALVASLALAVATTL